MVMSDLPKRRENGANRNNFGARSRLAVALLFQAILSTTHAFLPPPPPSTSIGYSSLPVTALFCQLLGMNCATPTDFVFSFQGFCQRGGVTDIHSHGWGLSFYDGRGVRTFLDTQASSTSPMAHFLGDASYPIRTLNMMAHIRFATRGKVDLANVHPFTREMWGINFSFAHNGDVPLFAEKQNGDNHAWIGDIKGDHHYHPVGDTDSEAVFCAILNALKAKFTTLPSLPVLHEFLNSLCEEIVAHDPDSTILNFLLTCGPHTQWVYSWPGARPGSNVWNGLHYTIREAPFSTARLRDLDVVVDFSTVTSPNDRVAVIATKPLTQNEDWVELKRGELILFDEGLPYHTSQQCVSVEKRGHGLETNASIAPPKLEEDKRRFASQPEKDFAGGGI